MEKQDPQESDQLPEEAPAEVVEDDAPDEAEESAGAAEESDPGQATGNPDNAGS